MKYKTSINSILEKAKSIDSILEKAKEYHKYNWLEEAEKLYRAILVKIPDHPDALHNLGDIAMRVNKPEVALVFFEKALGITPDCQEFQNSLANVKKKLESNSIINQNIEDSNIFELIGNDFVLERKIEALENKLFLLNDKINSIHGALNSCDVFDMKNIDDTSSRMLPVEIINKNSTKTLIAFGGMAQGLSMPPKEFFKSLVHKNINIVFVKDFKQCWYQKGLLGKTNDIESSIEYLKNIIPKTTEKLTALGASAGGFAAIRFGVALNADRIIAFSPQTLVDKETARVFSKSCLRDMVFDNFDLDLKEVLGKYNPKMKIEIYYAAKNNRDKEAADHIKDYTKEFSYETDTHLLAAYLKENGKLEEILDSI
jgi:tetratricopeptide (TPR) repeat protein